MRIKRRHWIILGGLATLAALAALALRPDVYVVESSSAQTGMLQVTIDEDGVTRLRTGNR